jgi:hypothetical protein
MSKYFAKKSRLVFRNRRKTKAAHEEHEGEERSGVKGRKK